MTTPTIGIDFDTTTSSIAWVDPGTGKAEILKNAEGEEKTPSVVWFGADQILVGTPAEQMLEDEEECWRRCGGDDFDQALYDWCEEAIVRQAGEPPNPQGRDWRFLRDCRRRKESLSVQDKVLFSRLVGAGRLFRHTLTREEFEGLIGARVEVTVRLAGELARAAAAQGFPVETAVLIGGSSRIPLVRRMLTEVLPVAPRKWQQQDVAVALGAAYFAHGVWEPRPRPQEPDPARDASAARPDPGSEWRQSGDTARRLLRGGSWSYFPRFARVSDRS